MSAISAANTSATSAIAQLLSNAASAATDGTSAASATAVGSSASSNPADTVDLSPHAKALLLQAQENQVAAKDLQAFLQSARSPNGSGAAAAAPAATTSSQSSAASVTQAFDQLTGKTPSQQPGGAAPGSLASFELAGGGASAGFSDYAQALGKASPQGFSQTLSNVVAVPSSPQEIAAWYQNDGKSTLLGAQAWPEDYPPGLAKAVTSQSLSFLSANDIPGLNFQNTITIQSAGAGVGGSDVYTYNHNAAIFSDPATSYLVQGDGTVLSWKTPPTTGTTASN